MFGKACLAVMLLGLSGCVGSEAQTKDSSDVPLTADTAQVDSETGAIEGLVLDDSALPVVGAAIQLVPGEYSSVSAADGAFSISRVPPGAYEMHVAKLGYEAAAKRISVVAGEITKTTLQVQPIAIDEPRVELFGPFPGYMQCRMATPLSSGACGFVPVVGNTPVSTAWANDKVIWNFGKFSSDKWRNIAFESKWTPSSAATNAKMIQPFSYDGRPSTHWWADSGPSDSPSQFVFIRDEDGPNGQVPSDTKKENREPTMDHTLRTWLTLPFAPATKPAELAYELRFEMMVTIFYDQDAPEAYTAFPDG